MGRGGEPPAYPEGAARVPAARQGRRLTRLAALLCTALFALAAHAETVERFLEHGGLKRRYIIYIPDAVKTSNSLRPALLNFHGGGGHAEQHMKTSGMNRAADKYGFLAVYPDDTSWSYEPSAGTLGAPKSVDASGLIGAFIGNAQP